ncbi:hypothetical protein ACFP2V_02475, partial [Streptomyces incanus]
MSRRSSTDGTDSSLRATLYSRDTVTRACSQRPNHTIPPCADDFSSGTGSLHDLRGHHLNDRTRSLEIDRT